MELCATKNHLPTCPSCYPTGYCQRRRASHPPSPIANRCGWPVPSEPPFLLLDASCPMMMMPSATNATTTTTTASYSGDSYSTLPLLLPPPHKQSPFLQKPMPSPDRCLPTEIPRGRKTRDDGEKTRYQKKKKGTREAPLCCVRGPTRPATPPSVAQQQTTTTIGISPRNLSRSAQNASPSRSRKVKKRSRRRCRHTCLLRAPTAATRKISERRARKGRGRKGIRDVDVGNHICNTEEGTGFPNVPSSSLLSVMVVVSGTSVFFLFGLGFLLMRQPPRPLPK